MAVINRDAMSFGGSVQFAKVLVAETRIGALDNQTCGFSWLERLLECIDHGHWILPLKSAVKVENEEVDKVTVSYSQLSSSSLPVSRRLWLKNEGHVHDGSRRERRQRGCYE